MRLETMTTDITITTSVQSLRQLATLRLSTVVNCLAGALESLAKVDYGVLEICEKRLTGSTLSRDLKRTSRWKSINHRHTSFTSSIPA
jgi:hypothetical protein